MEKNLKYFLAVNLKRLRGAQSQGEFADFLGIPQATYARYELGQRLPRASILAKIAAKTEYTAAALVSPDLGEGTGVARPGAPRISKKIPVISWAKAGESGFSPMDDLADFQDRMLDTPSKDPNAFAVEITGDSMEPRFLEGDLVVLEPNRLPQTGDYVVARIAAPSGERVVFKRFRRTGEQGEVIVLESVNPAYKPITLDAEAVVWAYPMLHFVGEPQVSAIALEILRSGVQSILDEDRHRAARQRKPQDREQAADAESGKGAQ